MKENTLVGIIFAATMLGLLLLFGVGVPWGPKALERDAQPQRDLIDRLVNPPAATRCYHH